MDCDDIEIVLKRPQFKYFYYAFCRFNDILASKKVTEDIKFPELNGKVCRALPYDRDIFRSSELDTNLFVKGIPKSWTHKELYEAFKEHGEILSCRVSINDAHESRGFGYL